MRILVIVHCHSHLQCSGASDWLMVLERMIALQGASWPGVGSYPQSQSSSGRLGPVTGLFSLICLCMSFNLDTMAPRVASMLGAVGSGDGARTVGWVVSSASESRYLTGLFTCRETRPCPQPLPRIFVPRTILANAQLGHHTKVCRSIDMLLLIYMNWLAVTQFTVR